MKSNQKTDAEKIQKIVDNIILKIKGEINDKKFDVSEEIESTLNDTLNNNIIQNTNQPQNNVTTTSNDINQFSTFRDSLNFYQDQFNVYDPNRLQNSKKFLKTIRRLLHHEINDWLLLPLVQKQTFFNVETIKTLEFIFRKISQLDSQNINAKSSLEELHSKTSATESSLEEIMNDLKMIKLELERKDLEIKVKHYFKAYLEKDPNPEQLEWLVSSILKGKLKLKGLPNHFKSLPEYKGIQLLKHGCIYTVFGTKMYLNKNDNNLSRAIAMFNFWEIEESNFLKKFLKKGMNVIDIGANIGYYTVLFSKWVGDEGKIFAFEPDPNSFNILAKNISVNNCNNVSLYQNAVSEKEGSTSLFVNYKDPGDNRIIDFYAYDGDEDRKKIETSMVTLDSIIDKDEKIDLIKMDIQGSEMLALLGMERTINDNEKLNMFVEFWPYGIEKSGFSPQDFIEKIKSLGFKIYYLENGKKIDFSINHDLINNYDIPDQMNLFCTKN